MTEADDVELVELRDIVLGALGDTKDVRLEMRDHRLWMQVKDFMVGSWRWQGTNYQCECFRGELFVARSLDLAVGRAVAAITQQLETSEPH